MNYIPITKAVFDEAEKEAIINAYAADRLSITLPLFAQMTPDEFNYVVSNLNEVVQSVV